jgi:hypothetical protein
MRRIIATIAIALPLAAHAAIPPGDDLDRCKFEARAKLARLVVEMKAMAPIEAWPITMLAIAAAEREIRSWKGLDGLDQCTKFVRSWTPSPREQKMARDDGRTYAGNDLAPYWVERRNRERQRDEEDRERAREFDRRWERNHRKQFDDMEREHREMRDRGRRREERDDD